MDVSLDSASPTGRDYAVRVAKTAQDQQRADGKAAVELIEQASAPPLGPDGQGAHINVRG